MSRQAEHVPAGLTGRDLVWDAMRDLRTFTVDELCKRTGLKRGSVDDYVQALIKAGLVIRSGDRPSPLGNAGSFPRAEYSFAAQVVPLETPRVHRDGTIIPQSGRQRMWRAMGILKEFSLRDLVATAGLPEAPIEITEAGYYCNWLARGGYLRSAASGRYLVIPAMRHGPRAPMIQRVRRLLDPNTGEIVCESAPVEEMAR
jgi:hypothetical protein